MTAGNNGAASPAILVQGLNECYERLAKMGSDGNGNTGEEFYQIVMEAEQLITKLTDLSKQAGTVFKRDELLNLNQKVISLIETIKQQMSSSTEQFIKVKKGQNAVKGYRPIRCGIGFTEGKFFDSKK